MRSNPFCGTPTRRGSPRATAGAKSFIFEAKLNRQTIRVTIGDVKAWNLDDARAEARRLQTLVDQGTDPRQEKAERIAATVAKQEEARRVEAPALDAWKTYIEARTTRWSPRTLLDHQRLTAPGGKPKTRGRKKGEGDTTQPGILLALLSGPLAKIDAPAVRSFLKDEAERRPTQAQNAFVRLRAFLNWCADRPEYKGQIHADACAPARPR
jgi:hypothetical protein